MSATGERESSRPPPTDPSTRTGWPVARLGSRPSVLQSMGRECGFPPGPRLTGLGHSTPTAPPGSGAVSSSASDATRASSVAELVPRVGHESVDDQDVDGEHRQRPERVGRDVVELADRVDARDGNAEPPGELTAAEEAERGQQHADA